MDRQPKKPCKFCTKTGHFPYECRLNPKKQIKRLKRSGFSGQRKPMNKMGKVTKQWLITRATWIRKNSPPIDGQYWECYLQIHPWCPKLIDIDQLTVDHVIARTRDASKRYSQDNLKPACKYCNEMKGSRSLDQVKKTPVQ